jgi:hypothetical protein
VAVRSHLFSSAPVTSPYDCDRDGKVTALDLLLCRRNLGRTLGTYPAPAPLAVPAAPPPKQSLEPLPGLWDEGATGRNQIDPLI